MKSLKLRLILGTALALPFATPATAWAEGTAARVSNSEDHSVIEQSGTAAVAQGAPADAAEDSNQVIVTGTRTGPQKWTSGIPAIAAPMAGRLSRRRPGGRGTRRRRAGRRAAS